MTGDVFGRQWLFEPVHINRFKQVCAPFGLSIGHRLVCIYHQVYTWPHGLTNRLETLQVLAGVRLANFDLYASPALGF